ncbi:MAG TPA: endo-1,4-beta-xylanase [Verrucomicrobiae bacterium]
MKMNFKVTTFVLAGIFMAGLLTSCATGGNSHSSPTLKDVFKNDFPIGVAINQNQFTGQDTNGVALIVSQFNAISPENVLKWETVHPQPGTNGYDFGPGDAYVKFGERHHMLIVGHTLVWHNQTPSWVFQDENGRWLSGTNAADRELLLQRMHDHIQTVVGHYKGRIKIWDVVNEALNDSPKLDDTNVLRQTSPWVRVLGMDFIVKAFEYAHEADPGAILRYNDYSIENPVKRQRLVTLIKYLQSQNVPVMAIGSQTHANLTWPAPDLEDSFLTEVSRLGLPIHITELDVNGSQAGQRNQSADITQNAQAGGDGQQTASVQEKLAQQYGDLFKVFLKHRDAIRLVTFWGVTDADSWRRNGHPLLFDGNWQPKLAFHAVINAAE